MHDDTTGRHRGVIADREAVAHHEAGHAVAATVLRLGFVHVTVHPTADALGVLLLRTSWIDEIRTHPHDASTAEGFIAAGRWEQGQALQQARSRHRRTRTLVMTLAGPVAQARHQGVATRDVLDEEGSAGDRSQVIDALLDWSRSSDQEQEFQRVLAAAEALMAAHWSGVRAVAAALLRRGTLRAPRVRQLIATAETHDA